jgi:MFS transporter, UMF1 family
MNQLQKGSKKLLNAWAFYDWANSVYALVISSTVFPLFIGVLFRSQKLETINFLGSPKSSETIISYVTAFGFLIIAFISPLLSGIADYLGNKKFFMKLFCFIGSVSCMLLYFFNLENLYFGLACYTLALIGYWGSLVFYNSYLPDIAYPEQQDAISAKGYSMGYIGSVLLLIINLAMIMLVPENMAVQMMKYSFVLVGLWWLGFSQYSYYYLPNNLTEKPVHINIVFNGFKELKKVWQLMQTLPKLKSYLTAFFVYSMAVQTIMIIAAYFGEKKVDWGGDKQRTTGLILSILIIQIIAVLGAFLTSKIAKKLGNITVLMHLNIFWIVICILAFFVVKPTEFYVVASLVGLVMGGIQSLSRSTYSKFIPENVTDTTSFFSFYDVAEKIGIVIGMSTYGFIADITGDMRNAILFLILFFGIGAILLFRIKMKEK